MIKKSVQNQFRIFKIRDEESCNKQNSEKISNKLFANKRIQMTKQLILQILKEQKLSNYSSIFKRIINETQKFFVMPKNVSTELNNPCGCNKTNNTNINGIQGVNSTNINLDKNIKKQKNGKINNKKVMNKGNSDNQKENDEKKIPKKDKKEN